MLQTVSIPTKSVTCKHANFKTELELTSGAKHFSIGDSSCLESWRRVQQNQNDDVCFVSFWCFGLRQQNDDSTQRRIGRTEDRPETVQHNNLKEECGRGTICLEDNLCECKR